MVKHNFIDDFVSAGHKTLCSGCGLTWGEIFLQTYYEGTAINQDDCDIRKRKQKLKAFW